MAEYARPSSDEGDKKPAERSSKTKYDLGCPAEERYEHLSGKRQQVIDKAREMARLTIPSVFPPDGYEPGDKTPRNEQSFGALCVNSLASKLMFMAMSPFRPVLRYQAIEYKLKQDIQQNPQMAAVVDAGLAELELEHRNRMEATSIRSTYTGAMKMALIGGNWLWDHMEINSPVCHSMLDYVVKRSKTGEQRLVILCEETDYEDLDEDIQELVLEKWQRDGKQVDTAKLYQETVKIYRVCRLVVDGKKKHWEYWEEFDGKCIKDTEFDAPFETPALYAAWLIPVKGKNWGRGYCEEYQGDLYACDALALALNDAAAAASLLLLFLKPGARTSLKQLREAENLSMLPGSGEDVTTFKLDKGMDLKFISEKEVQIAQRLGRVFLMVSSVQRQAERVTAEEWDKMTEEIEQATGGLYSEVGQTFQTHVIRRFVALHQEEDKNLPRVPEEYFRVTVVSAIGAMGRALEAQALARAVGTVGELFKEQGLKYMNILGVIRSIFAGEALRQRGHILSEEQVKSAMQEQMGNQMKQELLSKAAGPVAGQLTAAAAPAMVAAQQQQSTGEQPGDNPPPPEPPTEQPANPGAQ